jgi:hypothetical protein
MTTIASKKIQPNFHDDFLITSPSADVTNHARFSSTNANNIRPAPRSQRCAGIQKRARKEACDLVNRRFPRNQRSLTVASLNRDARRTMTRGVQLHHSPNGR